MANAPAYLPVVSLHLSRTLDEIGLNMATIKRRRHTFLYLENMKTEKYRFDGRNVSVFHFGSQTEGATTPGLYSDIDTLCSIRDYNILQDWSDWKQGKTNFLMLHENTAPGYCRLQLIKTYIPVAEEELPNEFCIHDESHRVLVKNTMESKLVSGPIGTRNGPARSLSGESGVMDNDVVLALPCSSWPMQAEEFTRRRRRHGWPSQRLLEQATAREVFLVPVGHKLSPTEPLEWRISASLAERYLMFSLTVVHIKCYVVLKMLVKTFVDPIVGKCISSYHCKTALFYCTESTTSRFWRDDNLLQCVQQCLVMLLTWINDGFCPQFIMPVENLFDGKVTAQNRKTVQTIFTRLVQSDGHALFCISKDDIGQKLQARISTLPSIVPVLDSLAIAELIGTFEFHFHEGAHNLVKSMLVKEKSATAVTAVRSIQQNITLLQDRTRQADNMERKAIQSYIEFLSCWVGSILASVALSRKMIVPRTAIHLFRIGSKFDVASLLKLASVLYSIGNLHKVELIVQSLESHFCKNEIQPACGCMDKSLNMSFEFCHMMQLTKGKRARATFVAKCVRFSPHEIHCAPPAVRSELVKPTDDAAQSKHQLNDKLPDFVAIDCLPYLEYLQYLTYRRLGKIGLRKRSLHNLERCIREAYDFSHLETDWNLLGQCREMEQELIDSDGLLQNVA